MTSNNIDLNGIDENIYYFLNPIFITIKSSSKFITQATFQLTNTKATGLDGTDLKTATFKLQANPEGIIYVDISEYIKSIAIYPNGYKSKTIDANIPNSLNDITFNVIVSTSTDNSTTTFNFRRLLLLGYEFSQNTNISLVSPAYLNLNSSPYYPYSGDIYKEFSAKRYRVSGSQRSILVDDLPSIDILNHCFVDGCNKVMFRFLNSLGGYQYIVFGDYVYSSSSEVSETKVKVNRYLSNKVSFIGNDVSHEKEYTATQSFKDRFSSFVDDFVRSQYVQVMFGEDNIWHEVDIQQNSTPTPNNGTFDFSYKFKLQTSINL